MDSLQDPIVQQWVEMFNHPNDASRSQALLAEEVVVVVFTQGKSGDSVRFHGRGEVADWLGQLPDDKYRFTPLTAEPCEPSADIPPGDRALQLRYQIIGDLGVIGRWTHHGDWTLHIRGAQVIAVVQAPDDVDGDGTSQLEGGKMEDLDALRTEYRRQQAMKHDAHDHHGHHHND